MEARGVWGAEVAGSSPARPTSLGMCPDVEKLDRKNKKLSQ